MALIEVIALLTMVADHCSIQLRIKHMMNYISEQDENLQQQHHWCSGNISAFQALAMDSISVWCIISFY